MSTVTYSRIELSSTTLNTYTSGTQKLPDILGLTNGGFVTAYNTDDNFDLLNFYDANGAVVGGFQIPYGSGNTTPQGQPSLTQLSNGNVVVIWKEHDSAVEGIRGAIFTSTGTAISTNFLVGPSPSDNFGTPTVNALTNGNFVVAAEYSGNIFVNLCGPTGSNILFYTQANTTTTGTQNDTQVTGLTGGGFAVTWTDTNPSDQQIRGRIYNADGTTISGSDFLVAQIGDNTQSSLASLKSGGFVVAYTDSGWAEGGTLGNGISLQYVSSTGALSTLVHVNAPTSADEVDPDVAVLANGYVMVTWTHTFSSADHDIYGALFDASGNRVTVNGATEFTIEGDGQDEITAALSSMKNGRFIVAWQNTTTGDIGSSLSEIVRTTQGDDSAESLTGDQMHDIIHAAGGADTINGVSGKDSLFGEAGNDTITVNNVQQIAGIVYDGGADTDTLVVGGPSYNYDFRDDTVNSFEMLTFSDPGTNGTATVMFNASQFGAGISMTATITGVTFGDVTDTVDITMGTATVLDLSGLTILNFTGVHDSIIVHGDGDVDKIFGSQVNDVFFGEGGNDYLAGKDGADKIFGMDGNDLLIGGAGADALDGGADVDTASYINAKKGVLASLANSAVNTQDAEGDTYTSIENLTGSNHGDTLWGNGVGNKISGGLGNDKIYGGLGNDLLIGGGGKDIFVFDTKPGSNNVDTINNFSTNDDVIWLDNDVFTKLGNAGGLSSAAFHEGAKAHDASDRIIYDSSNGNVWYDANGSGHGKAVLFAHLDAGLNISNSDFHIIG